MNDLNRKLHEARGLCWHEWQFSEKGSGGFKVKMKCRCGESKYRSYLVPNPAYDTDLVAAFELVDEMREKGCWVYIRGTDTHWQVEILGGVIVDESLPRAISLACAKALGTTED